MKLMTALALGLVILSPVATANGTGESASEQWEKALLGAKKAGTLPGPRPGQKCLWSQRLGACLWYTPQKFDLTPQ